MSSSMSSNAVLAKARAMYGKCLTDYDYQQLMDCHTVPEVASYLKTRTNYASVLAGMNENEVHRGQLEPVLWQNLYSDVSALSRYAADKSTAFSDFIISKMEIEQIIRCLTLVNIGRPDDYAYTMPLSLDKFAKISLQQLTSVRSYDDILEVLKGSKYYNLLKKYRPPESEKVNVSLLEAELNNQNYGELLSSVDKSKDRHEREEIKDLFSAVLDFENVSRILRLKHYYKFDEVQIKPMLIPYGKLKKKNIDEFCAAESVGEVFELSRSTYLGKLMSKLQYNDKSQLSTVMLSYYCKHHLRLSPNPTIVMISYVYLKEIELRNIVNIIEAARYGLTADEKAKLLVR